jgi:hypothetical protein
VLQNFVKHGKKIAILLDDLFVSGVVPLLLLGQVVKELIEPDFLQVSV